MCSPSPSDRKSTNFESVIKQLYDKRYLHRDVSINNVVLAERDDDVFEQVYKRLQGFLIDYDYAIFMDRLNSDARAEVTVSPCDPLL